MHGNTNKSSLRAVFLVLGSVMLGLMSAYFLKEAALRQYMSLSMLVLIVGMVAAVNGVRFLLWGYIHKHYPLSFSYPLSSLFFPSILVMGYYYGDPVDINQILGAILVTAGVAMMVYGEKSRE
jgi:drug/metabolite transporter (DMT)-like permease